VYVKCMTQLQYTQPDRRFQKFLKMLSHTPPRPLPPGTPPPPPKNITKEEEEALKELKDKEVITNLKADKRNATVIMNSEDYNEK